MLKPLTYVSGSKKADLRRSVMMTKKRDEIKKIPFVIISLFLSIFCGNRLFLFPEIIWITTIYMIGTAACYAYSVLKDDTIRFHTYIGWTWGIIPIGCTLFVLHDNQTAWNRLFLFTFGLCIAFVFAKLWEKDKLVKMSVFTFLGKVSILLIAGMISFLIMGLNESIIRNAEFDSTELIEKDTYESTQSFFDQISYYLDFNFEYEEIKITQLQVSEEYYSLLDKGDSVPICICTGLFGKKFYFLYMDPDPKWDSYGLNEWAREKALNNEIMTD